MTKAKSTKWKDYSKEQEKEIKKLCKETDKAMGDFLFLLYKDRKKAYKQGKRDAEKKYRKEIELLKDKYEANLIKVGLGLKLKRELGK